MQIEGKIRNIPARQIFCIVDGIVGGEGNGPLDATPKAAGVVLAGMNPVAIDLVGAYLMGFDYTRLPMLHKELGSNHFLPLAAFEYTEVTCKSDDHRFDGALNELDGKGFHFQPHFGWKNHIELT